jgi:DNA-binding response OmpR family regulator
MRETVLIVDDDDGVRGVLAMTLEQSGYDVTEASDGPAGIAELESPSPPRCVVLDLMMPEASGFDVLRVRRERKLAGSTRVLVLSARTGDRDFLRAFELGADDYLTKPFEAAELLEKIASLIASTPAELEQRRAAELEKSHLINRVNTAFDDPT